MIYCVSKVIDLTLSSEAGELVGNCSLMYHFLVPLHLYFPQVHCILHLFVGWNGRCFFIILAVYVIIFSINNLY